MKRGLVHAGHVYQDFRGCPRGLSATERCVVRYGIPALIASHMPLESERAEEHLHPEITASAFVDRGRWTVKCPWCSNQHYADLEDRRFLCTNCGNVGGDGKWVRVEIPEDPAAIERVLMDRPDPATRNWRPGVSVEFMEQENLARLGGS